MKGMQQNPKPVCSVVLQAYCGVRKAMVLLKWDCGKTHWSQLGASGIFLPRCKFCVAWGIVSTITKESRPWEEDKGKEKQMGGRLPKNYID